MLEKRVFRLFVFVYLYFLVKDSRLGKSVILDIFCKADMLHMLHMLKLIQTNLIYRLTNKIDCAIVVVYQNIIIREVLMCRYQKFLREMAIKPLLPALVTLLFAELIGGFLFNLDPVTIFVWFAVSFIAYYTTLVILAVIGALVYLGTPALICLVLAVAVLIGGTYLLMTKTNAAIDLMQILEDLNVPDQYLAFLQKPAEDHTEDLNKVQATLDASTPDVKKVDTVLDSENGKLTGSYNLIFNEDGTTTVEYTYEKYDAEAKEVKTETGTLTLKANGKLTEKEIKDDAFLTVMSLVIKLNGEKLKNVVFVSGTLSAKVNALDTEEVLGVAFDSDVYMVITMSRDNVVSINLTYDSADGKVNVSVGYVYLEEVTPETPEEPGEGIETPEVPVEGE